MESFYGGRQGASFVIVKQFDSIESMVQCFGQGAVTTNEVNYGEYVIIDTINKNNPDNGKVYRRGLNYQYSENNSLAGAEYIGQIVGPQGDSPEVSIDDFNAVINEPYNGPEKEYNIANGGIIKGAEIVYDSEGKIDEEQSVFNNSIKYTWATIRDEYGIVKGCKIGFAFPYTVFDFIAKIEEDSYKKTGLIKKIEYKDENEKDKYPFFSQWEISIPKGIQGDSLGKFIIEKGYAKNGVPYYDNPECENEAIGYLNEDVSINFNFYRDDYENSNPILKNGIIYYVKKTDCYKDVVIYKKISYKNSAEGNYEYSSLGAYNSINKIEISDDGKITIDYSHEGPVTLENQSIKWIDDIYIDSLGESGIEGEGSQKIYVKYNNSPSIEEIGSPINYIMETVITKLDNEDIELKGQDNLAENFHLLVLYSDPEYRANLGDRKKTWRSNKFIDENGKGVIRTDWCDMGYVRGESGGVHIIGTLEDDSLLTPDNPPEKLMNDHTYAGWSYAVGDGVNKTLYSYDYKNKKWDTLGTIGNSAVEPKAIIQQGFSIDSVDLLNANGIFLQLEQNYMVY